MDELDHQVSFIQLVLIEAELRHIHPRMKGADESIMLVSLAQIGGVVQESAGRDRGHRLRRVTLH